MNSNPLDALIHCLTRSNSLHVCGSYSALYQVELSNPEPGATVIRLSWVPTLGSSEVFTTRLTRKAISQGIFCPGSVFVCDDHEGYGTHLRMPPLPENRSLGDVLADFPLFRAFPISAILATTLMHAPGTETLLALFSAANLAAQHAPASACNLAMAALNTAVETLCIQRDAPVTGVTPPGPGPVAFA